MMKKLTLVIAIMATLAVPIQALASTTAQIKSRFNQLRTGDRTLCLSDIFYGSNVGIKVIENGFVVQKSKDALLYKTVIIYLLGNDVTVNIKSLVESKFEKESIHNEFKQSYVEVSGMDNPAQAEMKSRLINSYEQSLTQQQEPVPYSVISLTEKGYNMNEINKDSQVNSKCYITPAKADAK